MSECVIEGKIKDVQVCVSEDVLAGLVSHLTYKPYCLGYFSLPEGGGL